MQMNHFKLILFLNILYRKKKSLLCDELQIGVGIAFQMRITNLVVQKWRGVKRASLKVCTSFHLHTFTSLCHRVYGRNS